MPASRKIVDGEIIIDNENIIHLKENELRKRIRWNKISMIFQGAMNSLTQLYIKSTVRNTFKSSRNGGRTSPRNNKNT